ncbi:nucleoside-diphosphate-sugar epimerase [Thermosporothrix hazakensis]|uniref:Nucleoside-diphosphate-sugar epimerase n=1 Tax=Thermosporothrix hazakensis TaxID=644383 RepID=A0A326UDB0_THEHA|nr:NAD(P)-dependent oxidoreductase [Thermosporothrix hazakensis]PZW36582.1 nucleoside-diphosphate-sugar epimerase [Thermosporothrix hazakensis]GCE47233.1 hypothetical protein KTH_21020 [Thermosporothrix hazakensis]
MKIGIAGSTGVLGRALLPLLLQKGYIVRTVARTPEQVRALELAGAEVMQGDLLDPGTIARLPQLLKGCDVVIHIAGAVPPDPGATQDQIQVRRVLTESTRALLEISLAVGVKRYLQQSIVMGYQDSGDNWIYEGAPFDTTPQRLFISQPISEMEERIRAIPPEKLHWCTLRGGQFVGPETDQEQQLTLLRQGRLAVPCTGRHFLSPVHVHDMATAFVAALEAAPAGSTFNIVDEPIRCGEYFDRLADLLEVPHPPRQPMKPCPPSQRCSNLAARKLLHWQPVCGIWPTESMLLQER